MNQALSQPAVVTAVNETHDRPHESLQQELEHRFRHTLHTGQVSPLLHLVLRYRQEVQPCKETA
jgi:hypothetical protein